MQGVRSSLRAAFAVSSCILASLAAAGCRTSPHFPEEARAAESAIDRAEDAGAKERSAVLLAEARQTLDHAREAEKEAIEDEEAARQDLLRIEKRTVRARTRTELAQRKLADAEDAKGAQTRTLERLEQRRTELRGKGVAEDEVVRLTETDAAYANMRIRSSDATIAALKKELELLDLEKKDAELGKQAAQARLETARERRSHALALYGRALEQARVAEAEAHEAKRIETRERITQM